MTAKSNEINKYISSFPEKTQSLLKQVYSTIKKVIPEADECIKYMMPTFVLNGNLVHFAGYKNHIGFYPAPSGINAFKNELTGYNCSKGAIQFPLNKPLPLVLIVKIVRFRVKENTEKAKKKSLRVCKNGHQYYKSSNCPICPLCETNLAKQSQFLKLLVAPARRAIENKGIKTLRQLSQYSEKEILQLHGIGKSSIPTLKAALASKKLRFKK